MLRRGLIRRLTALLAIATLVLGQALVAAHACVLPPAMDAAAASCHQPDPDETAASLCKAHCEAGTQTVDQAKPLVAPALGAPISVLRIHDVAPVTAVTSASDWLAHTGAPPPFLLHRRLRI